MELIIDIPEEIVMAIHNGKDYRYDIHTAIAQGTPYNLKGDLISRSALKEQFRKAGKDYNRECVIEMLCALETIDNAPTVAVNCKDCDGYEAGYSAGLKDTDRPQGDIFPMELVMGKCPIDANGDCPLRPQGEWIVKGQDIYCSICNQESAYNEFGASKFSGFCPNCGAKMKGGAE